LLNAAARSEEAQVFADSALRQVLPSRQEAEVRLSIAGQHRPLASYRAAELAVMARNFSDPREPYPQLRRAFVYKEKLSRTPPHLARHRTDPGPAIPRVA